MQNSIHVSNHKYHDISPTSAHCYDIKLANQQKNVLNFWIGAFEEQWSTS